MPSLVVWCALTVIVKMLDWIKLSFWKMLLWAFYGKACNNLKGLLDDISPPKSANSFYTCRVANWPKKNKKQNLDAFFLFTHLPKKQAARLSPSLPSSASHQPSWTNKLCIRQCLQSLQKLLRLALEPLTRLCPYTFKNSRALPQTVKSCWAWF